MGARLRDIAEGRQDMVKIDPRLIRIEDGFNPRQYTLKENRDHLDALKSSIREMGVRVPVMVRWDVGTEQAILIDGECRVRACLELIAEGVDIKTIPVLQAQGANEADRLILAITTNTGKPLSQWGVWTGVPASRELRLDERRHCEEDGSNDSLRRRCSGVERRTTRKLKVMLSEGSVTPSLARKTLREKGSKAAESLRERASARPRPTARQQLHSQGSISSWRLPMPWRGKSSRKIPVGMR